MSLRSTSSLRATMVAAACLIAWSAPLSRSDAAPSVRVRLPDAPARFVYDEPGLLSRDERVALEDSLMKFDKQGIEIGVAIFNTIGNDPIEDVSLALAEKWRPGTAKTDNGALVVIALEEHAMRIETGYGLEGALPDVLAGRIIRNDMAPAFREGNFGEGISLAVSNIARAARGEAIPEPKEVQLPPWLPLIFLLMLVIFMSVAKRKARRAWSMGGLPGGLHRRGRGGPWMGGMGGFGGGGGGGFGGGSFGGGSFGGGGASGRW